MPLMQAVITGFLVDVGLILLVGGACILFEPPKARPVFAETTGTRVHAEVPVNAHLFQGVLYRVRFYDSNGNPMWGPGSDGWHGRIVYLGQAGEIRFA